MAEYRFYVDGLNLSALLNKMGGVDQAKRFIRGELELVEKGDTRLQRIKSIQISAVDITIREELLRKKYNIGWFGDNFRRIFFGKTFEGTDSGNLTLYQLKQYCTNQQIVDELGNKAVTSLARLFSLLGEQKNGQEGLLLTNDYANLMVVEINEKSQQFLWVVYCSWNVDHRYWRINATPVSDLKGWSSSYQVLSSNS